jgi:hypothetical protein
MKRETLDEEVRRTKARWLRRVMYDEEPTSTAKCLAFLIADHLNCVTLDAWPALSTIATLLGAKSTKTAQRAGRNLQALGYITIKPRGEGAAGYRYAPTFSSGDLDSSVAKNGQACPSSADTAVTESSSGTHLKSSPTPPSANAQANSTPSGLRYHPAERGMIEMYIASLLGRDGMELLTYLAAIDDTIVERLCRTYVENTLTRRELASARLAAEHYRSASRRSRFRGRRDAISALRSDDPRRQGT